MVVFNCIGSNIFDILLCFGLFWLVKSLFEGFIGYVEV